jgi:NAD(P)-dependent dehydrogenase (short-subunit alcohol dehydrogenase family)
MNNEKRGRKMRTYLITGGANGIGRFLVSSLVDSQNVVIFIDIDHQNAQKMIEQFDSKHLHYIQADLGKEADLNYIKDIIEKLNIKIDCLVHNACITKGGIKNASYDDFKKALDIGLVAPYYLSKLLIPFLNKNASIIHITSTRAFQSQQNTETYSATKGGLQALTHAMAMSLEGQVRVNAIAPGWINTNQDETISRNDLSDHEQHPVKRIGKPADILKAVLYLSDPENDFITGQTLVIDGGMSKKMIYHNDEDWSYKI